MFTVTLNKAKYIASNKDAIKRCPVTSRMHFHYKRNTETELVIV